MALPSGTTQTTLADRDTATVAFWWDTMGRTIGSHTLTATAALVGAADDNPSNNSRSATVAVSEAGASSPVVGACAPPSANPGDQGVVAVTGSKFQDGATADFGERVAVRSVTFVGSGQLDVQVKIHRRADAGPRNVTITNPDGQSGTKAGCFTVN